MSDEKYSSRVSYAKARLKRGVMRAVLAPLVSWAVPRGGGSEGYTIVIGCNHKLVPIAAANLCMLERQDLTGADRVLVVFDRTKAEMGAETERALRERYHRLPLEVLYYSKAQSRVSALFDWGWIYSWTSWSLGIKHARTRYVLLHDLDALLLRPQTLRERYEAIRTGDAEYLGIRYYMGGGVVPDDRLVTTFELIFDADFVRRQFRPIDLFNNVTRLGRRRVEFDTFLSAQNTAGRRGVLPLDTESMVHPSQMICQYVDYVNGRPIPPGINNILMIPYFFYLGGDPGPLREVLGQLKGTGSRVRVLGRELDAGQLTAKHAAWYTDQAEKLERELNGGMRPEIQNYFDLITARAAGGTAK
ncbi:hypothetical protein [Frigoriglobus tundricola]|uniref:Uncharacterized protein n=1 Tax=Frigoriglobus tundricola TaxID=2774151 RepID=A0A6M5YFC2_9BACT|nr:hypothetical protein [Frigoriglobus tundricola]QJW92707.1 hypothetical protein FTUN_0204 [Frigoriglobus tundricola]